MKSRLRIAWMVMAITICIAISARIAARSIYRYDNVSATDSPDNENRCYSFLMRSDNGIVYTAVGLRKAAWADLDTWRDSPPFSVLLGERPPLPNVFLCQGKHSISTQWVSGPPMTLNIATDCVLRLEAPHIITHTLSLNGVRIRYEFRPQVGG